MKIYKGIIFFVAITFIYAFALYLMVSKDDVLKIYEDFYRFFPQLVLFSFASYGVRYLRWLWLLKRANRGVNFVYGFFSYISGFAFTSLPGKVGELVRVRYFHRRGIPNDLILSAFIYEQIIDLISVLIISCLSITETKILIMAIGMVFFLLSLIFTLASKASWLTKCCIFFESRRFFRISKAIAFLGNGLIGAKRWFNPLDILVTLFLGVLAWLIISYAFIQLLSFLGEDLPFLIAIGIYPLGMLVGAISMLPGGLGSAEVALISALTYYGVNFKIAALASLGIRFSTLWISIISGFIAILILECYFKITKFYINDNINK